MTAPVSCLIVDDEPVARDILMRYCNQYPLLKVEAVCENAIEAKEILINKNIKIIFLDIQMPVLDGLSLLKTLRDAPLVIFTTAYKEFAINAFELDACDYLVKPFSFDRFIIAVDRAIARINDPGNIISGENKESRDSLFVKSDGIIHQLKFEEILLIEARGNYSRIITEKNQLLPNLTFSKLESMLPSNQFLRIHRSFIINRTKMDHIDGNRVIIGNHQIPIGRSYKNDFLKKLGI